MRLFLKKRKQHGSKTKFFFSATCHKTAPKGRICQTQPPYDSRGYKSTETFLYINGQKSRTSTQPKIQRPKSVLPTNTDSRVSSIIHIMLLLQSVFLSTAELNTNTPHFLYNFPFEFSRETIMVKGPGLYLDIGKKARGSSFLFFC